MRKSREKKVSTIREIGKLFKWYDPLYYFGDAMYRQGFKMAVFTGFFTAGGYIKGLWDSTGDVTLLNSLERAAVAISIPVAVGAGLTFSGLFLRNLPNMLHSGKIVLAEASDLHLMADYKRSRIAHYLDQLWERVYKHEAKIFFSEEESLREAKYIRGHVSQLTDALNGLPKKTLAFLGLKKSEDLGDLVNGALYAKPYTDGMESCREAFIISSMYALTHSLPQPEEAAQIGFDLSGLASWLHGGFFDSSDANLSRQYSGDSDLLAVKRDLGKGALASIAQAPKRLWQGLCFNFVTKALAVKVGTAVEAINRKYNTHEFNSQVFLWPDSEQAEWLKKFSGAKEEILQTREAILKSVFGRTFYDADVMLDRMFLPNFELATILRMNYDPEYCTGELGQNILQDLKSVDCCPEEYGRYRRMAAKARKSSSQFLNYLKTDRPELFESEEAEALRAVRIAYHIDKHGVQRAFRRGKVVDRLIEEAVSEKQKYSTRLRALRLHHQLTIFETQEYRDILERLAYPK